MVRDQAAHGGSLELVALDLAPWRASEPAPTRCWRTAGRSTSSSPTRRHGHADGSHGRRLRDAVRHEPPRALRPRDRIASLIRTAAGWSWSPRPVIATRNRISTTRASSTRPTTRWWRTGARRRPTSSSRWSSTGGTGRATCGRRPAPGGIQTELGRHVGQGAVAQSVERINADLAAAGKPAFPGRPFPKELPRRFGRPSWRRRRQSAAAIARTATCPGSRRVDHSRQRGGRALLCAGSRARACALGEERGLVGERY